jgi:uncharacterized membrane protein
MSSAVFAALHLVCLGGLGGAFGFCGGLITGPLASDFDVLPGILNLRGVR